MNPRETARNTVRNLLHPKETLTNRARKKFIENPLGKKNQLDEKYAKDFRNCPELAGLTDDQFPEELEVTPDGQRRFGKEMGMMSLKEAYTMGADNLISLTTAAYNLPIKKVFAWGWSADNWNRPDQEINIVMDVMDEKFPDLKGLVVERGGKFVLIGRHALRPEKAEKYTSYTQVLQQFMELERETQDNTGKVLAIAFDFGGEDQDIRSHDRAYEKGFNDRVRNGIVLNPNERARIQSSDDLWNFRDGGGEVKAASLGIRTGENLTPEEGLLATHISDVGWVNGKPTLWVYSEKKFPLFGLRDLALAIRIYASMEKRQGR